MKKCLTNGEGDGIISKLSARAVKKCQNEDQFERKWKSFLTNVSLCGILKKLRDEKRELGAQRHGSKNFEKNRKKFLTSWRKCGKLKKFTAVQKIDR